MFISSSCARAYTIEKPEYTFENLETLMKSYQILFFWKINLQLYSNNQIITHTIPYFTFNIEGAKEGDQQFGQLFMGQSVDQFSTRYDKFKKEMIEINELEEQSMERWRDIDQRKLSNGDANEEAKLEKRAKEREGIRKRFKEEYNDFDSYVTAFFSIIISQLEEMGFSHGTISNKMYFEV